MSFHCLSVARVPWLAHPRLSSLASMCVHGPRKQPYQTGKERVFQGADEINSMLEEEPSKIIQFFILSRTSGRCEE
jgi:hypothetical protein